MKAGFVQKLKTDISLLKSMVIKKEAQMKESSITVAPDIGGSNMQLNTNIGDPNKTARNLDFLDDPFGSTEGIKSADSSFDLDLSSSEMMSTTSLKAPSLKSPASSQMSTTSLKPASLKSPTSIHSIKLSESIKSRSTKSGSSSKSKLSSSSKSKLSNSNSSSSLMFGLSLSTESSLGSLESKLAFDWYEKISTIPECHSWTYSTFALLSIVQANGSSLSFIEHYFKWVYPILPIVDKNWFMKNMVSTST
jgi:hypothetical protein